MRTRQSTWTFIACAAVLLWMGLAGCEKSKSDGGSSESKEQAHSHGEGEDHAHEGEEGHHDHGEDGHHEGENGHHDHGENDHHGGDGHGDHAHNDGEGHHDHGDHGHGDHGHGDHGHGDKDHDHEMVEVPAEGKKFDPPVHRDQLPDGAWYCDMGKVPWAAMDKPEDGCPIEGAPLKQYGGE